jgi:hypothetical protein
MFPETYAELIAREQGEREEQQQQQNPEASTSKSGRPIRRSKRVDKIKKEKVICLFLFLSKASNLHFRSFRGLDKVMIVLHC